jgi:monoamine oxidase
VSNSEFDVVVVGAGAAGLAAARELSRTGLTCLVAEARERPGGRAWTTTLANGEAVDVGCGWLHSAESNPFAAIAQGQGRRLDKSPPPWARPDAQIGPLRERMAGFSAAIGAFRERVEAWPQDEPDVACDALLKPGDPFNPLIDAVSTWYSGAELSKVSAADLAAFEDTGVNWRVREGLGGAVAGLAEGLAIRFCCPVRAIDRSGARLAIRTDLGTVSARAVIVTLPTEVLAATPDLFRPARPDKTAAAHDLPLGLADKLYMELIGPHDLPAESRAFGALARATGAYHFLPHGRPLIEGFFGGELAEALERGGESAAFAFASDELAGLFGSDFRARIRPLQFHGWRSDVYARGGYSYARPGAVACRDVLAAPVDNRIFFAGEACSRLTFSTVHGAYESGLRAAADAARALRS